MNKAYSNMNVAITLNNLHETDEDASLLEGIAIPAERLESFLADVVTLAERHGGAGFDELVEKDTKDESLNAALAHGYRTLVDAVLMEAEAFLA